ncbi:hypothetical protein EOA85_01950 [Mesorhizobium sp. M5C.F.Ca.IN.020.29.1.1]|uniref:type III secretion apparatus assembly protein SctX n=1 Tax=Mesorhizobium sp. M5C.F.Ca.IN.020.29.1.1 TaxID=2496770 RepID=UPI000FCA7A64|nr:hypothetical protein [Mesorhizobium sp. M5C.F.Ca.IN.020.29.1.1]RUV64374.1 hypothetical protein EOA85_01950 [Mesorhizobium sp. M5C.F.Ca.IN.020.29.1.1]
MIRINSGSLNHSAPTISGSTELRRTGLVADARSALQFDLLYDAPTVDDLMMAAFAPPIANPAILESPTFAATLKAAHTSLADLVAQTGDPDRAVLCDALSVLDRAQCDRFFLKTPAVL